MINKKMLWNNDETKSVEAEKIKRLVIQRMTLFFECLNFRLWIVF